MAQDRGHQLTDKMLTDLEKRLHDEYEKAAKEIQLKLDDYMKRFRTKDKIWQKWVEDGKKTKEEYQQWRIGQMAVGERWEKMKDRIVADEMNANRIAREITNQEMPSIFSLNANYALYQVEHDAKIDTGMTLYNREAVDRILREDPDLLLPPGKKVSQQIKTKKAVRWEKQKIQSVMMQGIIQGESIPTIAARLSEEVATMDFNAAIRNARTMTTNAQNAGRYDAYERLTNNGVELTLEWAATLDNRTRHEHRMMHGQRRDVGEPFVIDGIEIMYPAQTGTFMGVSNIPQEYLWNCRCTILAFVKGFEHDTIKTSDKMGGMTFEEWLNAKPESQDIQHQYELGKEFEQSYIRQYGGGWGDDGGSPDSGAGPDGGGPGPVTGTDITETWERRSEEFKFEIDDVLDAQGFDGKPRFLSQEEFEEAVKAANGGNGFIAQRTYSAPDQETLDAYRDQLYDGKWYVDCSTGGAGYGQGMYCAADYTGTLSDGIKAEMQHYYDQYVGTLGHEVSEDEWLKKASPLLDKYGVDKSKYNEIARAYIDENDSLFERLTGDLSDSKRDDLYEELYNKAKTRAVYNYVETFTLDPSAKVITYRELMDIQTGSLSMDYRTDVIKDLVKKGGYTDDEATFIRYNLNTGVTWKEVSAAAGRLTGERIEELSEEFSKIGEEATKRWNEEHDRRVERAKTLQHKFKDPGSLAAALGYDAINAEGHGQSGSYTVIVNRTKVIFLRKD